MEKHEHGFAAGYMCNKRIIDVSCKNPYLVSEIMPQNTENVLSS